jgi:hypothetical protein
MKTAPIPEYTPRHPSLKDWSQKCVEFLPFSPNNKPSLAALMNLSTTKILVTSTTFHIPHLHLSIFAIYFDNKLHISNYMLESSQKCCMTSALLHAL